MTFEEGSGAYDQRDAAGFIKLNALRLRTLAATETLVVIPALSRDLLAQIEGRPRQRG